MDITKNKSEKNCFQQRNEDGTFASQNCIEDFYGKKFSSLLVIGKTPIKDKRGKKVYECLCDCGRTRYFELSSLRTGHNTTCGQCDISEKKRIAACSGVDDISNMKFNHLLAIEPVGQDIHNRAIWKFLCDCGNEFVCPAYNVKSGNTKSCGCLRHKHSHNFKDLTGMVFGRLTVIRESDIKKKGKILWHCECSCGNFVEVESIKLTKGLQKSCGCLLKEKQSNAIYKNKWSSHIRDIFVRCLKCGSVERIHAHHIYPKNQFPQMAENPANGIALCSKCHRDFHQLYGNKCTIYDIEKFLSTPSPNIQAVDNIIKAFQEDSKEKEIEDLQKAIWYINDRIEQLKNS